MTTSQEKPAKDADTFRFLAEHAFIVLTTYRKDGTTVPTTIWFVYDQGRVYFTTQKGAGKAKRIRNSGRVLLTPSDRVGKLLNLPEVEGEAEELAESEYTIALTLLRQKYGEQFDQITSGSDAALRTYFVIQPMMEN